MIVPQGYKIQGIYLLDWYSFCVYKLNACGEGDGYDL